MVPACRDGRMPENCVAVISTGRLRRLPISLARSTLKPSIPPESFGMAWGAKVPSTAVLSGCWAGAGEGASSRREPIATPAGRLRKRMTSLRARPSAGVRRRQRLAPFWNGGATLDGEWAKDCFHGRALHQSQAPNRRDGRTIIAGLVLE